MGKIRVLFYFAGRFLRMDINRNNSRTGDPIKLIFGYVVYFRGILDSQEAKFRFFHFSRRNPHFFMKRTHYLTTSDILRS